MLTPCGRRRVINLPSVLLTVSGSARPDSANVRLLRALPTLFPERVIQHSTVPERLPLFTEPAQAQPTPAVVAWRTQVRMAQGVVFCTPAYLHNLPALLKNALEWLTAGGELAGKPCLALTLTPHAPRGERAMRALVWSLQALDARVVAELPLYRDEVQLTEAGIAGEDARAMLREAVGLLGIATA